jgi:hypothetical protein
MTPDFVKVVLEQTPNFVEVVLEPTPNFVEVVLEPTPNCVEVVLEPTPNCVEVVLEPTPNFVEVDVAIDWKARAKFFERSLDALMDLQTMFTGVPVDWKETLQSAEAMTSLAPGEFSIMDQIKEAVSTLTVKTDTLMTRCDTLDISVYQLKGALEVAEAFAKALGEALSQSEARYNALAEAMAQGEARNNALAEAMAHGEARYNAVAMTLAETERSNEELATNSAILRAQIWDQRRIISENHSGNYSEVQKENASLLAKLEGARHALRKTGPFGGEERALLIKTLGKLRYEKSVLEEHFELVRTENARLSVIVHDYATAKEEKP